MKCKYNAYFNAKINKQYLLYVNKKRNISTYYRNHQKKSKIYFARINIFL